MALQDLTPQLRTRLSRMEKAVGWFVILALSLLVFGFVYYVYNTAERKGWFKTKALYFTFAASAEGLHPGDPVKLMGLEVGQITQIQPMPPEDFQYNMYIEFEIKEPYYGYLWTEGSRAKVATADLLGKRVLEVSKGTGGYPTYVFNPVRQVSLAEARSFAEPKRWLWGEEILDPSGTNVLARPLEPVGHLDAIAQAGFTNLTVLDGAEKRGKMTGVWNDKAGRYDEFTARSKPYWLLSDESPAVTERLEKLVSQVEKALPNVLSLTNQLAAVLSHGVDLASNLNAVALEARPALSNLAAATAHLDQPGALGQWLLPTNANRQLEASLTSAHLVLESANTNLAALAENLARSLDNLAGITSNLNAQVQANTNILQAVSDTVQHADQFIQGLKRHWLLRSAFKNEKTTNAPPGAVSTPRSPLKSPKDLQ